MTGFVSALFNAGVDLGDATCIIIGLVFGCFNLCHNFLKYFLYGFMMITITIESVTGRIRNRHTNSVLIAGAGVVLNREGDIISGVSNIWNSKLDYNKVQNFTCFLKPTFPLKVAL